MEASLSDLYSNVTYHHLEERDISSDNSGDNSPPSTTFTTASISSPKRSRRAIQKKVVTFPLKEVEGSRFKGDCTPPSDSWAWRKYGQKPIKGSPYPRGYYRCSSSKGCPARKQVERSRSDPNSLVVTYSYEHNHPWPISRNHHQNRHHNSNTSTSTTAATTSTQGPEQAVTPAACPTISSLPSSTTTTHNFTADNNNNNNNVRNTTSLVQPRLLGNDNNLADQQQQQQQQQLHHHQQSILFQQNMDHQEPLIPPTDELTWLASDHQLFENNSFFSNFNDVDMAKIFPMREEDESLFADLGELPECSVVFRKAVGAAAAGEETNLAPTATWCGTTG